MTTTGTRVLLAASEPRLFAAVATACSTSAKRSPRPCLSCLIFFFFTLLRSMMTGRVFTVVSFDDASIRLKSGGPDWLRYGLGERGYRGGRVPTKFESEQSKSIRFTYL